MQSDLFLYADDTCLAFQSKNVKDIENQLDKDFANICHWFVDSKQVFTSMEIKLSPSFSLLNIRSKSFRS